MYHESKQRDGYRPLTLKLRQVGLGLNHKTVLKLMHELRIRSILRKYEPPRQLLRQRRD
ncbi:IS3 family transposase [Actinobacillus minor]|uniref:IS3 family transposase n=1 Tax=Actinobacillus minor TaxID=51047 RepID=UPI0023F2C0A6|nr:IS3 family transposase [Actinobacillus minor]MDD6911749.1 IS3 family transposase [Actinobacillus minor]